MSFKLLVGLLALFMVHTGCVKLPDRVSSASLRINYANVEGQGEYTVIFSCFIENDNPNRVLVNLTADVQVSIGQGAIIEVFPVEAKAILPFSDEMVENVQVRTREEILPLIEILNIDEDALIKMGTIRPIRLSDVRFSNVRSSQMKINDYLKGKINEKNN